MNCICDCTGKSVRNLENAMQNLLDRGQQVNEILENQKRKEVVPMRSDTTMMTKIPAPSPINVPITKKPGSLYNKNTKHGENIDFEIPSLTEEKSITPVKSSSKPRSFLFNKNTKTAETVDFEIPLLLKEKSTTKVNSKISGITLNDSYNVEIDGNTRNLPSKIEISQGKKKSLNVCYQFLDACGNILMKLNFNLKSGEVRNLKLDGKKYKN
ncbi:unnamed protein product [Caenorhabditis angaria]|uniref:Uncharacterized protein n=1 Tax=Caenorhabditis angaria TaxID=860376 RepID=A0A9P1IGR0_9PELO|nr:unnamed protein product [Caenorhabditis angaria]